MELVKSFPHISSQILLPVQEQFKKLLQQEDFVRKAQNEEVKQQLMLLLSLLKGVVMGSRVDNVPDLFSFCVPLLNESVALMKTYQNCPEIIEMLLSVFVEVASRQLCYLNEVGRCLFHIVCTSYKWLLQVYVSLIIY